MLGVVWFLMALGAFTRDVAHIMVSIVPVLMFATPIFYRLEQMPPHISIWLRLNLVGDYIEMLRDVALDGVLPTSFAYVALVGHLLRRVPLRLPVLHALQIGDRRCHLRPIIRCDGVGKAFQLYLHRNDQLKQVLFGLWRNVLQGALGAP